MNPNLKAPPTGAAVDFLAEQWRACGLANGDLVMVHSDITPTILRSRRRGAPVSVEDILFSLLAAVGESGTLLLPLFNFGFTQGRPFNLKTTPSQMGALTEAARKFPATVRTGHPVYSFAAIGRLAGRFGGICNFSAYGPDSPFAILRESDGIVAVLDLPDQRSMTYYHHVEETANVSYRYQKVFRGPYTNLAGEMRLRDFSIFVRDLDRGIVTSLGGMEEHLWSTGCYRGNRPGMGAGMRVGRAREIHAATAEVIRSGRAEGMLFKVDRIHDGNH